LVFNLYEFRLGSHPNVEHEHDVIKMNEVRCCASGRVQRAAPKVTQMIYEPGHPADSLVIA